MRSTRHLSPTLSLGVLAVLTGWGLSHPSPAQVPYSGQPDWLSSETNAFGTGCDFADVDGDGFIDLAVSNGNDIVQAPNYVYLNAVGDLPHAASWVSDDLNFSGHCEFGDIDGDGFPELAVANYIAPGWQPAGVQVYANLAGVLAATPAWVSSDSFHTFRTTFGDADGDGDLDLAVATGEAYYGVYEPNRIYYNQAGVLATEPGWISADADASYDVQFVDIDADGDLDLAFLTTLGPVKIYENIAGTIQPLPFWTTSSSDNGNSFDFADVNQDGYLDLAVAYNFQLGGTGQYKIYYSDQGSLPSTADWASASGGYGSEAIFCDVDDDGDEDLVGGRWWGLVEIYLNEAGMFATAPHWTSSPEYESVVENIAFTDLDNSHQELRSRSFSGDGQRKLFYLDDRHLQGLAGVMADGVELSPQDYCYHRKNGWVSLANAAIGDVVVRYRVSPRRDMAVANWDGATYVFWNNAVTAVAAGGGSGPATGFSAAFPNPFNAYTGIRYELAQASLVTLEIFDLSGRCIDFLQQQREPGLHTLAWDASRQASGIYFYVLRHEGGTSRGKLTLVK